MHPLIIKMFQIVLSLVQHTSGGRHQLPEMEKKMGKENEWMNDSLAQEEILTLFCTERLYYENSLTWR